MKKIGLFALIVLLGITFLGCEPNSSQSVPTKTPIKLETENPDIRGNISEIYINDGKITGIFIAGVIEADTVYAKAMVGINQDTHVYINFNGEITETDTSHLEKNQTVEALFTGPILTSDPVQATAIEIEILK